MTSTSGTQSAAPKLASSTNRRKTMAGHEPSKYDQTRLRIERMEEERNQRRKQTEEKKASRKAEQAKLLAAGNPGDVDFIGMVQQWREEQDKIHRKQQHTSSNNGNIIVAVRKRPMSDKERHKKDHDSVSCYHPKIWVHSAKTKVDGITKFLTHTGFQFDHAFGEDSTTDQIYVATTMPLLDHVIQTQGRATCFCYGQTGSGKTYTMSAIQQMLARDLYEELKETNVNAKVTLAFFELYNGNVQDLLHGRKRCKLLEDGKGEINITGLQEVPANNAEDFLRIIADGHGERTTHTTEANDCSSRSHAICQVFLREPSSGKLKGKLTLVDLAGSERGSDTKTHNSQRRAESAEINTSLLALKECIRALGQKGAHVQYRGSKLTLLLKDCFSPNSKTTMIAMVSPGASSTDHSLNTLRYADRIKEQKITSSVKKSSESSTKPFSNSTSHQPSKQRLARILSALEWEPSNTNSSVHSVIEHGIDEILASRSESPCRTEAAEQANDHCFAVESVSTLSGEQSDLEEEKLVASSASVTGDGTPSQEEEAAARKSAAELFKLEEELKDEHMFCLQNMAEMLHDEFRMIQAIEAADNISGDDMDSYAIKLAEYLDRKDILIRNVRSKFDELRKKQKAMER